LIQLQCSTKKLTLQNMRQKYEQIITPINELEHHIQVSNNPLSTIIACAKLFRLYEENGIPTCYRFTNINPNICRAYKQRTFEAIRKFEMKKFDNQNSSTTKILRQKLENFEIYDFTKFDNFTTPDVPINGDESPLYDETRSEDSPDTFLKFYNYDTDDSNDDDNNSDSDSQDSNDSDDDSDDH